MMKTEPTIVPIYTTSGDVGAFLVKPYIFDRQGDWIGWVTPDRKVYSVHGSYVGWLSQDPRILRRRAESYGESHMSAPPRPPRFSVPATAPLAPMMSELTQSVQDVLDEEPELMPTIDFGEERLDLD